MKKTCKILFLAILTIMLIFNFSATVNAADVVEGYDDYEELGDDKVITNDDTKNDNNANKNVTTNTTTNTTNNTPVTTQEVQPKTDTAPTAHPQTGIYSTTAFALIAISATALIVSYKKSKKYNY